MPLPNTRVIHPGWSAHHRPVARGAQTAECAITRSNDDGYVDDGGTYHPPTRATIYTGGCRVQPRPTDERTAVIGEETVTLHRYLVAVEHDVAEVLIDDLVEITAAAGDPSLTGRKLRVVDVQYASEVWERDLICEEVLDG